MLKKLLQEVFDKFGSFAGNDFPGNKDCEGHVYYQCGDAATGARIYRKILESARRRAGSGNTPAPGFPPGGLAANCKCCGSTAELYGVVDFNKNCEAIRKPVLVEPSGIPIAYLRCQDCGFIFTTAFDDFSRDDFKARIYNRDYHLVDPDFELARPDANAVLVFDLFGSSAETIAVLDYGGGKGLLADLLRNAGFKNANVYDPMYGGHIDRPEGRFDLITSFEVAEHSTDPRGAFLEMASMLKPRGVILFSTLLQPRDIDQLGVGWWYIGPRNGHASIFSHDALIKLFAGLNFEFGSFNELLHIAYRELPPFAKHLAGSYRGEKLC